MYLGIGIACHTTILGNAINYYDFCEYNYLKRIIDTNRLVLIIVIGIIIIAHALLYFLPYPP